MTFFELITAAWRGATDAARGNARLFQLTLAALFVMAFLFRAITPPVHYEMTDSGRLMPQFGAGFWLVALLALIVTAIISAPAMVAVHRFVLLGETGTAMASQQRLIRFAGLLILLRLAFQLPSIIAAIIAPFLGVLGIVVLILAIRWALTYPAAALDQSTPVSRSFGLTKGHWWYSAGAFIAAFLPIIAAELVMTFLVPGMRQFDASLGFGALLVYAVLNALYTLVFVSVGAAVASELYRKFGGMAA